MGNKNKIGAGSAAASSQQMPQAPVSEPAPPVLPVVEVTLAVAQAEVNPLQGQGGPDCRVVPKALRDHLIHRPILIDEMFDARIMEARKWSVLDC